MNSGVDDGRISTVQFSGSLSEAVSDFSSIE